MSKFLIILVATIFICSVVYTEKITYISVEHPAVTYVNTKYVKDNVQLLAYRYGRRSPVYYVTLHFEWLIYFANNVTVDFYFYEFLTNRYHRSFVEMHFKLCDLIHKDMFFGRALKQGPFDRPCPYPPGVYHLVNMTIQPEAIPRGFPFTKGRIYCNLSMPQLKVYLGGGYVDMEIKTIKVPDRQKFSKL